MVTWHVFLSSTGQCFPPVSLSWLAIICFQSLPIPLFLYLKKKKKSLKAFHSYLLLTAVVLNKVKQMMLLILHFQRILAKPCCSLGPTDQGTWEYFSPPGSVGAPCPDPEQRLGWDVVSSLLTQPRDPKCLSWERAGMCSHRSLAAT